MTTQCEESEAVLEKLEIASIDASAELLAAQLSNGASAEAWQQCVPPPGWKSAVCQAPTARKPTTTKGTSELCSAGAVTIALLNQQFPGRKVPEITSLSKKKWPLHAHALADIGEA